jgi:hypothetical protein
MDCFPFRCPEFLEVVLWAGATNACQIPRVVPRPTDPIHFYSSGHFLGGIRIRIALRVNAKEGEPVRENDQGPILLKAKYCRITGIKFE